MKRPLGPGAYSDVIPMLELALARQKPRITFTCASRAAAIHAVHRMNAWRHRCRVVDPNGNSVYDVFIFRTEGVEVYIDMRPAIACVSARDEDGEIPLDSIVTVDKQVNLVREMGRLMGNDDDSV